VLRGVIKGISDLGMSCFAYTEGVFVAGGAGLPLGYPNGMTATRVANAMIEKYQPANCQTCTCLRTRARPGILASKKSRQVTR